jgi:hypothetical protein
MIAIQFFMASVASFLTGNLSPFLSVTSKYIVCIGNSNGVFDQEFSAASKDSDSTALSLVKLE